MSLNTDTENGASESPSRGDVVHFQSEFQHRCDNIAETCARIRVLQRQRVYCIVNQSRIDRATDSYLAPDLGYRPDLPEKERKEIFAKAQELRLLIETGRAKKSRTKPPTEFDPDMVERFRLIVTAAAQARLAFDTIREQSETMMADLATGLPGAQWVKSVPGATLHSFAVIVGEAGDLGAYSTIGKVWKRFGLAPHEGRAASTWRRTGGLKAAEWQTVGFSPARLGQLYGVVLVPLFMHKAKNPYGAVYEKGRARYDERVALTQDMPAKIGDNMNAEKWTPKRADNAARRLMVKAFLKDLRVAWNKEDPRREMALRSIEFVH